MTVRSFTTLLGRTLSEVHGLEAGSEEVNFFTDNYQHFRMYHKQECSESVLIEDVVGDVNDLLNSPILQLEEVSQVGNTQAASSTWTFYKIATNKGSVTIRWLGESNGYYSEAVSFKQIA